MSASTDQRFGRYRLLEPLGAGGMAEVWHARLEGDAGFTRDVVIKRIRTSMLANREFAELFAREARLSARLHHANIVQVFEYGEIDGEPYLAMEFMAGVDLHRLMRSTAGPMPYGLVALIGREVGRALEYAHDARDDEGRLVHLVHRDISPSNVMVGFDGSVKLFDFGIARTANEAPLTHTGSFRGKVGYTAPEVIEGLPHDARSDLFGVGVMLHELLTGNRLFAGSNDAATLKLAHAAEAPLLSTVVADVPVALERCVHRLLSRLPGDRYETAGAFVTAIDAVVHDLQTGPAQLSDFVRRHHHSTPATVARPVLRPSAPNAETGSVEVVLVEPSRRRWPTVVAALGVAVVAGLVWWRSGTTPAAAARVPVAPPVVASARPPPSTEPLAPAKVSVQLRSTPPEAMVLVGGAARGATPLTLELDPDEVPLSLRFEHPRYEPLEVTLQPGQLEVDVVLPPRPRPAKPKAPTRRAPKETTPDIEGGQVVDPFR